MNALKYLFAVAFLVPIAISCNKDKYEDTSFVANATLPQNMSCLFDITQDNTGLVTITPNGEGASWYEVYFGDTTKTPTTVMAGKGIQHKYPEGVFDVKLVAHNLSGKTSESIQKLTVSFRAPENLVVNAALDAVNIFKVNVAATAKYETLFKVYFGDVANEVPQSFLEGSTISHVYAAVGTYTIKVVALSGGAATTQYTTTITVVDPILLPIDFESNTLNFAFGNFDGGVLSVVSNTLATGINTSAKVAKMVKNGGQTWGGSSLKIANPIDFSVNKVFRMKVYSPRVGAKVLLKVENALDGRISFEQQALTTVANAWEDLVFDYTDINTANTYQNLVIIFDNGTMGDGSANYTFYIDDIRLTATVPNVLMDLPITFDAAGVNYAVTDFGGANSQKATDPANAANKVKKTTKPNGAETWAGTTMGLGFNTKIPFTASATQMSVKVYSPAAGIRVRLKVEDKTNGNKSVETEAVTTQANTWETLVFDFANQASGTAAMNLAYNYDKASIFFDFNVAGNGKVFYWDDVKFLTTNVAPTGLVLPLDFQSTTLNYAFTDFGGGNIAVIDNPQKSGTNLSTKVARMIKYAGETWGGSFISLDNPINFSTKKIIKMKVFSPRIGAKIFLKLENQTNGAINDSREVATTVAGAWQELTFDFSTINTGLSYQKLVFIVDNGTAGDGSANYTFLFDDITLN